MLVRVAEPETMIENPQVVYDLLSGALRSEDPADQDKEHFWTIGLTTRNSVKYIDLVSLGILNTSLVHPREVFRLSISQAASSILLAHNHPSGDPEPSAEDVALTRRLTEAGKIIGIEVIDHVIIGADRYTSFREKGLI
jgi:DNA repair protein RadC